jgi:predicted Fe-Mo cluster-binding NifX family protein
MIIAVPILEYRGFDSPLFGHFGSAPAFALADTENGGVVPLENNNQHHEHGQCSPLRALAGHHVDAVICRGIGQGALMQLDRAGVAVYGTQSVTLREALEAWQEGRLPRFGSDQACAGHAHGHGHDQGGCCGH